MSRKEVNNHLDRYVKSSLSLPNVKDAKVEGEEETR
jgi:hypothetical protein